MKIVSMTIISFFPFALTKFHDKQNDPGVSREERCHHVLLPDRGDEAVGGQEEAWQAEGIPRVAHHVVSSQSHVANAAEGELVVAAEGGGRRVASSRIGI